MSYPESIDKFTEKLNKLDNNTYVIEEIVNLVDGKYEGELQHDNVSTSSINVYTGSKLTGDKVENVIVSTPSLTPWKRNIKIFSNISPVYISYETQGDTVESEDINKVQDSIVNTQTALNAEKDRATAKETTLENNLNSEILRAENTEVTLTNNLNSEISRAKNREDTIEGNLNNEISRAESTENTEINRAKGAENVLTNNLNSEINRATQSENNINTSLVGEISRAKNTEQNLTDNLNSEIERATGVEETLNENLSSEINRAKQAENSISNTINTNKPNWDDKYTKNEVDNKISQVISSMDWKESVATYNDIAATYPNPEDGWTVNVKDTDITYRYDGRVWIPISANSIPLATSTVDGKMSKVDKVKLDGIENNANKYIHPETHPGSMIEEDTTHRWTTDTEKANWNDAYGKEHTHSNKSILDTITQALIDTWNSAYNHISDTIKHITSDERTLWNTVSNKVDKITGKSLSTNDFDNTYKAKIDGISANAKKVASSTTNGNVKIDDVETTVYTHPGTGTNPHGTTKSDVGLSNVTNDPQVKRAEMGITSGVATLDSSGVNAQAPKIHTHIKSQITDFPSSMPANGGTSSFLGNAVNVSDYNTLNPSLIAQGNVTPIKAPSTANSPWNNTTAGFLVQSNDSDSFHVLIFRSGGDGWAYRSYYQSIWSTWKIWSTFSGSYADLTNKPTIPTKTSQLINDGNGTNNFATVDLINSINTIIGTATLSTVDKTLKGAINELKSNISSGGTVDNANKLNGQTADYYLNYSNFTNKPTSLPASGGNATTATKASITHRLYRHDPESEDVYYISPWWTGNWNGWRIGAYNTSGDEQANVHRVSVDKSDYADSAGNSDTLDGIHSSGFGRAYSSSYSFGGSSDAITTADFITLLSSLGAFNQPYWVARGSWSYASNKYISDTGIGNIHLAGCTIEVIGSSSVYTIRIHTPTTSGVTSVVCSEFIYVNNGSTYSPGWRKIWNDKNDGSGSGLDADTVDGKHLSSLVSKGCTWNDLKGV